MRQTPKGWTHKRFSIYIMQCALRDRESYLESLSPGFYEPNTDLQMQIMETKDEISSMRARLSKLLPKGKETK